MADVVHIRCYIFYSFNYYQSWVQKNVTKVDPWSFRGSFGVITKMKMWGLFTNTLNRFPTLKPSWTESLFLLSNKILTSVHELYDWQKFPSMILFNGSRMKQEFEDDLRNGAVCRMTEIGRLHDIEIFCWLVSPIWKIQSSWSLHSYIWWWRKQVWWWNCDCLSLQYCIILA